MARATGYAITYDDANYMIANEGFTLLGTHTTGLRCMTASVITAYMNAEPSNYSGYSSNQLVPYHLLSPPTCVNNAIPQNVRIVTRDIGGGVFEYDVMCDAISGVIYYSIYRDGILFDNLHPSNVFTIGDSVDLGSYSWTMTSWINCESNQSASAVYGSCGVTETSQDTQYCPAGIIVNLDVCVPTGFIIGTDAIKVYVNGVLDATWFNSTSISIEIPESTTVSVDCSIRWLPEDVESARLATPLSVTSVACATVPDDVTGVIASQFLENVVVGWDTATGATSYNIYRSVNGGSYSLHANEVSTQYTDPFSDKIGFTYCYKVKGLNAQGESVNYSNIDCETIQ